MSLNSLIADLDATQTRLRRADWFNDAKPTQRALSVLLPPELRYLAETIGLAELANEVTEERIEIRDVEAPGFDDLTEAMRGWREDRDMPEQESQLTMEQLSLGRAYISVSSYSGDDDTPVFTVESPYHMMHANDPRTGDMIEAVRKYGDVGDPGYAHYTPDGVKYYKTSKLGGKFVSDPEMRDQEYRDLLGGDLPISLFLHRSRKREGWGKPAAKRLWGLQEDMSRTLTDLAAACGLLAIPTRAIMGIDKNDMKDDKGNDISAAKLWMGRLLTLSDPTARIAEFAAAQLTQFTSTMVSYARLASAMSGIPTVFFGVTSEANPSSGDAQRADMDRFNKRCERVCRGQRGPWKKAYRVGAKLTGVTDPEALRAIQVSFENPATFTVNQRSAAAVALAGVKRLPDAMFTPKYIMDLMGISAQKQAEMDEQATESALDRLIGQLPPGPPVAA